MATFLAVSVAAYLIGSVPFGLLLTSAAGLGDIRRIGSGNIGATNVLRTGRKELALATLVLDALKGVVAVVLAPAVARLVSDPVPPHAPAAVFAVAAVAAVVGHCAPVWLRFRGGKGVATGLGAFAGLDWRVGVGACACWVLAAALSRRSSVGALTAFAGGVALALALDPAPVAVAAFAIAALVTMRHRGNIARLLAGTEPAIGRRTA